MNPVVFPRLSEGSTGQPLSTEPRLAKGPPGIGTPIGWPGFVAISSARGEAGSFGSGEASDELRPASVGDDRRAVGSREGAGDDGEAVIDAVHDVGWQDDVDDKGHRERVGVGCEEDDSLLHAVFKDKEPPSWLIGYRVAALIPDRDQLIQIVYGGVELRDRAPPVSV